MHSVFVSSSTCTLVSDASTNFVTILTHMLLFSNRNFCEFMLAACSTEVPELAAGGNIDDPSRMLSGVASGVGIEAVASAGGNDQADPDLGVRLDSLSLYLNI